MKKLLLLALTAAAGIVGYRKYQERLQDKGSWEAATDPVD